MRVPPAVINTGVNIGGRHTDGVTLIMLPSTKFENLEEERQLNPGTVLNTSAPMRENGSTRRWPASRLHASKLTPRVSASQTSSS
eukprot:3701702-Pyramimonas_sp.AAC.1